MKFLTTTALALTLLTVSGCAEAGDMSRKDIEKIVKEYILENPEIIREAMFELEARDASLALEAEKQSLVDAHDALTKDPRDISIGPDDAKVTIVEFFDYNCGYCKSSSAWIRTVIQEYPDDVRVIFKELPILEGRTRTSKNAAKAAMAAGKQGKYSTFHFSLMNEKKLSPERVDLLAKEIGLDMEKYKKDMQDPALDRQLQDSLILANQLPALTGTPFFIINDEYMAGGNIEMLEDMLQRQLKKS